MDRRGFFGAVGSAAIFATTRRVYSGPSPRNSVLVERWSWAMGQPVVLRLFAESEAQGYDAAQAAFAELRRVEGHLSRFDPASDLVALNDQAGGRPLRVGKDLATVLTAAEAFRRGTAGAFDPAIEPVMRAWGFHAARTEGPTGVELEEARAAVSAARVSISGDRVGLSGRAVALDLGGIGVGYGLDRAGATLRGHGIRAALLNVSGDCLAIGAPPGERGWRIELADPSRPGYVVGTVHLRDSALATSANTVSVLQWRGRVVGHVMDPRTGGPAGRVRQVSVEAPSGLLADAWSTALLVAPLPLPRRCRAHVIA